MTVMSINSSLSLSQAAAHAGCGERTLMRAIGTGQLDAVKEHGHLLIAKTDLDRWIAARQAHRAPRLEDVLADVLSSTAELAAEKTTTP